MEYSIPTLLGLNMTANLWPQQEPMCMLGSIAGTKHSKLSQCAQPSGSKEGSRNCFTNSHLFPSTSVSSQHAALSEKWESACQNIPWWPF